MTHTDLSQNDKLPGPGDHNEPDGPGTSTNPATGTSPSQSAVRPRGDATTAQTASAGDPAPGPASASAPPEHVAAAQPAAGQPEQAARQSTPDSQRPRQPLLAPEELQSIVGRWRDIQAGFVDEPRRAVKDADALVADLMQRLTRMFAAERQELESRWMAGDDVSTEELRQGLRRYRSFFERLLAA